MGPSRRSLGILFAASLTCALAVRADDPVATLPQAPETPWSTEAEIRKLRDRIDALERAAKQSPAPKEDAKKEEGEGKAKQESKEEWIEVGKDRKLTSNVWEHGPLFETADGSFRFHIGGRFDFDNAWYKPDPSLPFVLDDGTAFRRARLRVDGTLWELMDFATEVNFANVQDINSVNATVQIGSVGLRDFWVQFKQVPGVGNIRVGHLKPPTSLERMTSSNVWYYMERSPGHDAFLNPFEYTNGVMLFDSWLDERMTAAVAFCKVGQSTINPFGFDSADGQYGVFGRVTALPVYADEGRTLVHVGIGGFHTDPDTNSLDTGDRPLIRAGGGGQIPNLLQTGTFFTPDGITVGNAEAALVLGRFSLSAEYTLTNTRNIFSSFNGLQYRGPRGTAIYHAAYVEAGIFLTPGDYRRYDRQRGAWGRTEPVENAFLVRGDGGGVCWGRGAVQLLCRYTYLDLASGDPVLTTTSGAGAGREDDLTVGLAWYLNSQVNVQTNYVYTKLRYVNGTGGDFHGLGCRVHLDF